MNSTYSFQSSFYITQKNNNVWINNGRKLSNISLHRSKLVCSLASLNPGIISGSSGRFGKYGGKYVPEILITSLCDLEAEFYKALNDENFQEELRTALRDYVGRETPLYFAKRLTNYYKNKNDGSGPEIYLKREDLNHGGAHKINNALAQAMLALRMGRTRIVTATGAGQHGVATAAVCAKLGLNCTVFMGHLDIERQSSNVNLMHVLGAQEELRTALRDYVGRETPLYFAKRLTNYYKNKNDGSGPEIYLKREDLNHGGAHKINNALAQAMLARRMGRTRIVTATGAGQHGVATAAVCAKLGLNCTVFMGHLDIERQSSNVNLMHVLGAQEELRTALRDYVGRETPLYFAKRLTNYYKNKNDGSGPEIYLKREDLNHGGAHKINNALAQAMLARRMGRTRIVTATGAGQHGVATAAVCAKLGLNCTVFMGHLDIERQSSNVNLMHVLGAQVKSVDGTFKEACSDAVREWVANLETAYHLQSSIIGPHPCPTMVREFQSVIGKEVRKQSLENWGGKPDVLVACVGGGSNAIGLFHEFISDQEIRLIGIEAGGSGLETGRHSATLSKGEIGVYHGAMSYLLQDDEGQIIGPHSIGVGLECPGVGPELSYLKDIERAEFHAVTNEEALYAYKRLCKLEGIFPALETSHALAYLDKLCPTLSDETKVVVNCSGRGDKDVATVLNLDSTRLSRSC